MCPCCMAYTTAGLETLQEAERNLCPHEANTQWRRKQRVNWQLHEVENFRVQILLPFLVG